MITTDMLDGNSIRTSNYAEECPYGDNPLTLQSNGTWTCPVHGVQQGNPTAGAKLDKNGTAFKVAPGNLQLGPKIFTDFGSMCAGGVIWTATNGTIGFSSSFGIVAADHYLNPNYGVQCIRVQLSDGYVTPFAVLNQWPFNGAGALLPMWNPQVTYGIGFATYCYIFLRNWTSGSLVDPRTLETSWGLLVFRQNG